MAVNFPDSPSNGDTFTSGALTFTWNGEAWKLDPSSGTKGEKGQKGEVGVTGEKGQKGQKGEVGDKGQKGEIGATGGSGGTGQKGQKGEQGASGSNGSDGDKGDKGQKGEIGASGTGTGTADKIFENNTSVECVDTGTGVVEVKVDGTETMTVVQGEVGINQSDPRATLDVFRTSDNYPAINIEGGNDTYGDLTVESGQILQTGHWNRSTNTFTERFRFGTKGALGIEGANYGSSGQVLSSKGSNYPPGWVNASNVAGLKGQKGEVGADNSTKGQKGEAGADNSTKGQKGEAGADNSTKGQKGEAGAAASKGQKGEQGAGGSGGDKGQKGAQGDGGAGGSAGDKGQKGETGGAGSSVPSGGIIIWSGASNAIPSGWYLCNGSNGTPDLRNRFIVGAGSGYSVNATGGYTDAVVVSHSHNVSGNTGNVGNHAHNHSRLNYNDSDTSGVPTGNSGSNQAAGQSFSNNYTTGGAGAHSHSISGTANATGNTASGRNLPPYYALCYIMKS